MRHILNGALLSFVALVSGCANSGQYGPSISYEEASSFEKALQAKEVPQPKMPEMLYTQPVNKDVPCKLPTSQDQLARSNFRAYWDGQCKDGYAFGLGRDIAISDTHHVEEITLHGATWYTPNVPGVLYDFVNNTVTYYMLGERYPESSRISEQIENNINGFNIVYTVGAMDQLGHVLMTQSSPFNPKRVFANTDQHIIYMFTDNSSMPVVDASAPSFAAQQLDSKTKEPGGVMLVRYGNGQVRHFMFSGNEPNMVTLPAEYLSHLNEKYKAVLNSQAAAITSIERARQIEREYLYMACNGKHTISGLDKETSTQICTWRDQFKAPYEKALAKYTHELEQMKQKAENVEQQRQIQEQIALQEQQMALQESLNTLGQMGQQMRSSSQQMLQSVMSAPPPQVIPWKPSGGNQVNCVTVGSVTNCR